MIEKRHAIRTEDESIWIDFEGDIPRVGDSISLKLVGKGYEIGKENIDKKWVVFKVLWLFCDWRKESFPSENMETIMISQARVFIKEF